MFSLLPGKRHRLFLLLTFLTLSASAQVSLPTSRQIYQRGQDNHTFIPIQGQCPSGTVRVEATAAVINGGNGVGWTTVVEPVSGTGFSGRLRLQGGWYGLTVRAVGAGGVLATWTVDRVGVGEVFIVTGHSVSAGDPAYPFAASTEDRVNTIARPPTFAERDTYDKNPVAALMPRAWAQFGEVRPAPFGDLPYFWSKCAEKLVNRLGVPVAMYQTSFGGTNLEHMWKSSKGILFDHSFCRSDLRLPYINMKNALTVYSAQSGVRSLMADHGANDAGNPDANGIANYYKGWLDQARADFGFPVWALINRATVVYKSDGSRFPQVRAAQEITAAYTNCAPGPDYDTQLLPSDRYDNIHMAVSGMDRAAQIWADAVSDSFLQRATPFQPTWPNGLTTTPVVVNPPATTANYRGHLDVATCSTISGFAVNLNNPTQPVGVDVYLNGNKAITLLPNQERTDVALAYSLPASVLSTNKFGYVWNLPESAKTGSPITVSVRHAGTTIDLFNSPAQTLACPASGVTNPVVITPVVVTPPAGARFDGWLDGANCNSINGWVANLNNPTQPVSVDLFVDGQKVTTLLPNQERGDVATALRLPTSVLSTNKFGYVWNLPDYLKTGRTLTISARQAGTTIELAGSPRQTPTCPASGVTKPVDTSVTVVAPVVVTPVTPPAGARFDGWLEGADCNIINGWAVNLNNPGQPVAVDIYLNGQKVVTITPNDERRDVLTAYNLPISTLSTNKFGYRWSLPAQYKTGKPIAVSVRHAGTNTELAGSPRQTPTCAAGGRINAQPNEVKANEAPFNSSLIF